MLIASQPQYVLVAQALMQDIASGRYPVGELLPPEMELCVQFGISRHTIREAIRKLQERGLITRQRGVGTRVKAQQGESKYVQSASTIPDLLQYAKDTRLVPGKLSEVITNQALGEKLRCRVGQRWVLIKGIRYAGKEKLPMALTEIYLNPAYSGIKQLVGTLKLPVHTLIEKQYGERIVEVKQEISAILIPAADARLLKVVAGSAGLLITRKYLGANDQILEMAVNLHPTSRYSYCMSLQLQLQPVAAD
ncbi:MAG: GntR family transcriptional regulator [Proteobacteria bacterium]|nr:GntR family transcriptional regulator [Pseudomonadota bacterium]